MMGGIKVVIKSFYNFKLEAEMGITPRKSRAGRQPRNISFFIDSLVSF